MAIDYVINYDCIPRQTLNTEGIVERLKGQNRAETIIGMYRERGDERSPDKIGFEFTRSTPDGEQETKVVIVQDLLDAAAELEPLASHCRECSANRKGEPFGCIGFIQYPISAEGEEWLINRLPVPDEPLVWMLLNQGVREFNYDGSAAKPLRAGASTYFESARAIKRKLGETEITSDQVFEMIFGVGHIIPNHGALLLLFFHAIGRELEADEIMNITPAGEKAGKKHPFILSHADGENNTIHEFKDFLHALYTAWRLNVKLLVDS